MKKLKLIIISFLFILISCGNLYNDVLAPFLQNSGCIDYIPSSWEFVDGGGGDGINWDNNKAAEFPQLTEYNGRLYAAWHEYKPLSKLQIRVAVYNGSNWAFIDGGGDNGINKEHSEHASRPQLTVYNGRLYAAWHEYKPLLELQIRVAVYNGTDWIFVDGDGTNGINYDPTWAASHPQLTVYNGMLYASWYEDNGPDQIRVKAYNGSTWGFIDGDVANGINKEPSKNAAYPQLIVFNGRLYATWKEQKTGGIIYQTRVALYNGGNTWNFVDGNGDNGLNYDIDAIVDSPQLTVFNCDLYAIWMEDDKIRVKKSIR